MWEESLYAAIDKTPLLIEDWKLIERKLYEYSDGDVVYWAI